MARRVRRPKRERPVPFEYIKIEVSHNGVIHRGQIMLAQELTPAQRDQIANFVAQVVRDLK